MILFAVTIVFASFDLEMSLSALWFSTMFPVYFFAGAFLSALCTIMLTGLWLQRTGRVTDRDHDRALSRSGQADAGLHYLLGLHRIQSVHADLVREHSRRDVLVQLANQPARLEDVIPDSAGWAFVHSILFADGTGTSSKPTTTDDLSDLYFW